MQILLFSLEAVIGGFAGFFIGILVSHKREMKIKLEMQQNREMVMRHYQGDIAVLAKTSS